jgi:hypothetical protein
MRRIAVLAAAATVFALVPAAASADVPAADAGDPAGPLNHVIVGNDLSCQAQHIADSAPEFAAPVLGTADCGTFLAVDGGLYAPAFGAHGSTNTGGLGSYTPWTSVSQDAVKGGVATVVTAGSTGLRVTQSDSYNAGQDAWRTDVSITNTGSATKSVTLYRAGDCNLQGTGSGYGFADSAHGGGGCAAQPNNSPADRVIDWVPLNHAASFVHTRASALWTAIGTKSPFPGTCVDCTSETDNGAGISWSFDIVPGETITRSHWTVLSPVGRTGPPAPVAPPPPVEPTTTTVQGTTVTFTGPPGCVPAGKRYRLRVTSMRKKKISRDRFGYERRVRILRVEFSVDGDKRLTDKKASFKALMSSAGAAPGTHALTARILIQPLKARGRQVLVGKKFWKMLPSSVNFCPPV